MKVSKEEFLKFAPYMELVERYATSVIYMCVLPLSGSCASESGVAYRYFQQWENGDITVSS